MSNTLLESIQPSLSEKFGSDLLSAEMYYDFPVFTVSRERITEVLKFLKEEKGFRFLTTLCGLHYPDKNQLGVMYQLHNLPENQRIRLKIFMDVNDAVAPTASDLFATANWMERQEFDFFGIYFKGHPNLKRILNVDNMTMFPLRKEHPLEDPTRDDKDDEMFGRLRPSELRSR